MHDLPAGTFTFLFTDIEGSTRLWEEHPDLMRRALARHDALLRAAIAGNDGRVFSTAGDALCAAFPTASNALTAAHGAQLAFAHEPWPEPVRIKVRMALHTGAAELRDNDYFGQPLNRAARLLSAGHGGQILLSLATQELVRDSLPAGVALRDMGERRLRDLIRPERVYQLIGAGIARDFPPLRTLDARPHNLPIQVTSFVGRNDEMREARALLRSSRLVTFTGSGGVGKTRLALQIGAELIDGYADGVWFVELAPLRDPRLVAQAVATALGIKEQPGVALIDTLIKETRNRELLLILDNCEHLIEASALLCRELVSAGAAIGILATSREALRLPGEASYRVPSLASPGAQAPARIASLTQYAAVQLFIDRARLVKPSFQVDNANAPAVASICHHLDGIPLALELAAARLRSMAVEQVNDRLDQRFRLLTGGSRAALPRQQTLRALIDWSYDLLGPTEQALLRRVAVFAGGWSLESAEAVCAGEPIEPVDVLELLTSLADKSLVVTDERDGATRYRLLETVRQYAWDRLRACSEEAPWADRHVAHFVELAEAAQPGLIGADQKNWLDRLEMEHDNLRSALTRSLAPGGDATSGMRLASGIMKFWQVRGYLSEGRAWLSRLLAAASSGQSPFRAKALNAAGLLACDQGDFAAARALYEECLAIQRALGDRRGIAVLLDNLGTVLRYQGDPGAWALHAESLAIRRELGDRQGIAGALSNMGVVAYYQGDFVNARALQEESLAINRQLGDSRSVGSSLNNLGGLALRQGDHAAARALFEESLAIHRELNDRRRIAISLVNVGMAASAQGAHADAQNLFTQSLSIQRELDDRWGIAGSLDALAYVASVLTGRGRAPRLWGAAERLRERMGAPLSQSDQARNDQQVTAARNAFGNDVAFERAWREGRDLSLDEAIEFALAPQDA